MSGYDLRSVRVHQQQRCPECGDSTFVTDAVTGEIMCSNCGLVLVEDMLDRAPEWRAFS
jgi:transcription initiation factor TFIIB